MAGYCSATSFKPGVEHWNWKGASVGYVAAHERVSGQYGKASSYRCATCGQPAQDWAYDGLDDGELTGTGRMAGLKYSVDPAHYRPLCRRCNLAEGRKPGPKPRSVS
jgi:hypothetical protein